MLYRQSGQKVSFGFAVRDAHRAKASLFRAPDLAAKSSFYGFDKRSFDAFRPNLIINAAGPELNLQIARYAPDAGAHYADMASDIYLEDTTQTTHHTKGAI